MKYALLSFIAALSTSHALATMREFKPERIIIMNTTEFNTLDNKKGKQKYVNEVTEHLQQLNVRVGNFNARQVEPGDVFDLIQNLSAWDPIVKAVKKTCAQKKDKETQAVCAAMEKSRLDIADFIHENPESEDDEEQGASKGAR